MDSGSCRTKRIGAVSRVAMNSIFAPVMNPIAQQERQQHRGHDARALHQRARHAGAPLPCMRRARAGRKRNACAGPLNAEGIDRKRIPMRCKIIRIFGILSVNIVEPVPASCFVFRSLPTTTSDGTRLGGAPNHAHFLLEADYMQNKNAFFGRSLQAEA